MAQRLRLSLLGSIELLGLPRAEGDRVTAQPKRCALLLYLALARPRGWQRRDTLLGLLWPELDEAHARNALSQSLHHLRRSLGSDTIEGNGPELLRLNRDRITVDVWEFEDLAGGQPASALPLFAGEVARGFHLSHAPDFEQWLDGERLRLRAAAFQVAVAVADAAELAGDLKGTGTALERAAELRPEDEALVQRLMQLRLQAGDRGAGLQAFERFAHWCRTELETDPSAATVALAAGLREASPPPLPARVTAEPAVPAVPSAPRARRHALSGLVLALCLGLLILTAARRVLHREPSPAGHLVLVAPFHVAEGDTTLGFLREGMVDLLAAKLTGEVGARALDSRRVLAAARDARLGHDLLPDQANDLARRLGAGWTITGSVTRSGEALIVQAGLRRVDGSGEPAAARASGTLEDLARLVDDVASQLLLAQSHEPALRLPELAQHPFPALQSYLEGRSAYRRGQYPAAARAFRAALDLDSTFSLAALYLADAIDWTGSEDAIRARNRAWALRDALAPADRAYLVALLGSRYPSLPATGERLVAWEHAAALTPDRPEGWFGLGDLLYHRGMVIGAPLARNRAAEAFRRAVAMDSTYVAPLAHLTDIAFESGDTAAARKLATHYLAVDSSSGIAAYFRWRLEPRRSALPVLAFHDMPSEGVFRVAVASQLQVVGVEDGRAAAQELVHRAVTAQELSAARRLRWLIAINTGHMNDFARYLGEVTPTPAGAIYAAHLFGDGDSTWGRRYAGSRILFLRFLAALDGLWQGSLPPEATETALLRDLADTAEEWTASAVIELAATARCRRNPTNAAVAVARLDSLIAAGPPDSDWRGYAPLLLARCREWRGEPEAALATLRRRPNEAWAGLPYLATYLREEGRLSLAVGDTAAAIQAWGRYLDLREAADPVLVPEREQVRARWTPLMERRAPAHGDRRNVIPG